MIAILVRIVLFIVLAPLLGGLLSGIDRIISARMQGRVGPPVQQAFYDVLKLLQKETLVVRRSQNFYITFFLILAVFTGALFAAGANILLVIFAHTLAGIFFVLGGYKASSPYSFIGAQRELIQMVSYEPAVLLAAIGMYMVTRSFNVGAIAVYSKPLALPLAGLFLAFLYILIIKLRKSPFDLSTSHHAHQELVKGITTEFSGKALAMIEVAHWYENVIALGFVYLFFAYNLWAGIAAVAIAYFLMILVDNSFARAKWQSTMATAWMVTAVLGVGNIIVLYYFTK